MSAIELLTVGDDGHAVEGPQFPDDLDIAATYAVEDESPSNRSATTAPIGPSYGYRLAYRHKFFRRDEHGQPMPETLVAFLVPGYLLDNGFPSRRALDLVAERMGWQ